MKPAPFAYHAPPTVEAALGLLASDPAAMVLAGGQSLVPLLKLRSARPSALVDINGIPGLDGIELADGELRIGALVRQQTLLADARVGAACPLLIEAVQHVGYRATRHRGTIGGSLAYAAPWAELAAAVVALDATIEARSADGVRSIRAREFFRGEHETDLAPGELVTRVRVPVQAARTGAAFHEVSARYRDYAQVGAAALVTLGADGTCTGAELVLLRVAPTPHRAEIDAIVRGTTLDDATLDAVAASLADLRPPGDVEVSGVYRHRVVAVLARRALRQAAERAGEERA